MAWPSHTVPVTVVGLDGVGGRLRARAAQPVVRPGVQAREVRAPTAGARTGVERGRAADLVATVRHRAGRSVTLLEEPETALRPEIPGRTGQRDTWF
jgi:hypothetical protein